MLKVAHLSKTYDRSTRHANTVLRDISFELPDRGFVCILGTSGCGKTSLLNAIGGLDAYDSGIVETERTRVERPLSRAMERERNASFGYIFQNYYLLSEHSVAYNVYLGMHSLDISEKEKMHRVKDALARVDMLRYRKRSVSDLSGGQQQRVAIARAIARRPRVIFADEPTGNLDESNTLNICTILKELSRDSLVVMVTHEERIARFFADRIITMEDGRILSDTVDWDRESIDAGEKDTVYAAEYTEERLHAQGLDLRILREEGTPTVDLTLLVEDNRIILKVNDTRTVLCSKPTVAPFLAEGKRPKLMAETITESSADKPCEASPSSEEKRRRRPLALGALVREALHLTVGQKRRRIGIGIFVVLLSVMLSLTVADAITIAHIDHEDFVTTNSHTLELSFKRGEDFNFDDPSVNIESMHLSLVPYIQEYIEHLGASGLEIDYLMDIKSTLVYVDESIPQFDTVPLTFVYESFVNADRLDPEALIAGRMPTNANELVIDRWVIEKTLEKDGILQNIIPDAEFFLDKTLKTAKGGYAPKIVGICDSGEPSIYVTKTGFLELSAFYIHATTPAEFTALTGMELPEIRPGEAIYIHTMEDEISRIGEVYRFTAATSVQIVSEVISPKAAYTLRTPIIIHEDTLDELYMQLLASVQVFDVWCEDREALKTYMEKPLPEGLEGMLAVLIEDDYARTYNEYMDHVTSRIGARTIVTVAILLMSCVMLYIMQRAAIRSHMDLVAVYRLLGIPKGRLIAIFSIESLLSTARFAVPSVLLSYGGIALMNLLNEATVLIYPAWAMLATVGLIAVLRMLMVILPVVRLMSSPPARLAAKYDF